MMEKLKVGSEVYYTGKLSLVRWMGWTTAARNNCMLLLQLKGLSDKYVLDKDLIAVYLEDIKLPRRVSAMFPEELCQSLPAPLSFKDVKDLVRKRDGGQVGFSFKSNSCYLDVSLMSMFAFTDAFDNLLPLPVLFPEGRDPTSYICLRVQAALRQLVRRLRSERLVDNNATILLRELLTTQQIQLTRDREPFWETEESDPPALLDFLVSSILKTHLTYVMEVEPGTYYFSPRTRDVFYVFCYRPNERVITYQQYLEDSLQADKCRLTGKFKTDCPQRIVIQLQGRYQGTPHEDVKYAWPTLVLDITDLLYEDVHQCHLCGEYAELHCEKCRDLLTEDDISTYYCVQCYFSVHKQTDRELWIDHKPLQLTLRSEPGSVPHRTILLLRSVLSIAARHYTGFLRADDQRNYWQWLYYNDLGPTMIEVDMQAIVTSHAKSQILETGQDPAGYLESQLLCNGYVVFYDKPSKVFM